jgi:hypothetical protein
VSISFRIIPGPGGQKNYEQVLAIAQTNMGVVVQAGYDNSQETVTYTEFQNTIYLGAYNDVNA